MATYQIDEMDRKVLNLVAKGEAVGSNPYSSLYPNGINTRIPTFTLEQLRQFQAERVRSGFQSSAAGRYQFVGSMLWGDYTNGDFPKFPGKGLIAQVGLPANIVFTPSVQDWLIVQRLKLTRKYDQWKSKSLDSTSFTFELAKEFASVPVPFDTQGEKRQVRRGESYYTGVGSNSTRMNVDVYILGLEDIRKGGTGEVTNLDLETGSTAYTPSGATARAQAEIRAAGGQQIRGGYGADSPIPSNQLPFANNPYIYKKIDPLDNRYDFRTGEKVRDLLINGVNPMSNLGLVPGNGLPPIDDLGTIGFTESEEGLYLDGRQLRDGDRISKTRIIETPAGKKVINETFDIRNTPSGLVPIEVPSTKSPEPFTGGRGAALATAPKGPIFTAGNTRKELPPASKIGPQ
jgi:muramidase (phage lysozyme)